MIIELCIKNHNRTHWRSYSTSRKFPHSDQYKLKAAIVQNDLEMIKVVLDRENVCIDDYIDNEKEITSLGLASMVGKIHVIDYLIDKGADLDATSKYDNTPLMLAVCEN
mmetsp:Transcript_37496/g.6743  ORF Transcript_37496/g.6743 Transcript_37496/m.6743 type:complete len:109 (+) Transcript_37496:237-563(+)